MDRFVEHTGGNLIVLLRDSAIIGYKSLTVVAGILGEKLNEKLLGFARKDRTHDTWMLLLFVPGCNIKTAAVKKRSPKQLCPLQRFR